MRLLQNPQSARRRQWRYLSPSSACWRRRLPSCPGVYVFYGKNNKVLYVGKSKSLRNRVSSYFQSRADLIPKVRIFVPQISKIRICETKTEFEALLLEARLIQELGPKYNSRLTDDKSPLYIVVTDENFPRVLTARKTDLAGVGSRSLYGPFLSGETVRRVLKIARRMFPYCNKRRTLSLRADPRYHFLDTLGQEPSLTSSSPPGQSKTNVLAGSSSIVSKMTSSGQLNLRPCFYRHLGLCPGVCSGEISRRRYLAIIKKLELFLAGDFAGLKVKLEVEMKSAAKKQEFEKAAKARDAAQALGSLGLAGEQGEEMIVGAKERMKALIKLLNRVGIGRTVRQWNGETVVSKTVGRYTDSSAYRSTDYRSTVSQFHRYTDFRIEGFDVSNLGGRLATAAMAVFIGGVREIGKYRHFRIRGGRRLERAERVERPSEAIRSGRRRRPRSLGYARDDANGDDPRMIAEAVERRMGHPEWGRPDLVLIDGGEPQLLCIKRTLLGARQGESLIYLGLAKNPDRLVIPTATGFKTIRVSDRDLGFQLLQQVRDEAHRFSRRLHLGLRRRSLVG